ncbi:ECF transporter S component [Lachnospiraceae bacterium NSJ-143]|nr:ECF transporter S component [Lachnospiraceae bacterium NSJ-143]
MKEKMTTKQLCIGGLFIAIVCLCTMMLQIPVPATSGYIHLGDSVILIIAVFFGWKYGMLAGGIGSALADLFSGYPHWVLFTLIIKGTMGLLIGSVSDFDRGNRNIFSARNVLASVIGIACMVAGYLLGGTVLKGSFAVALTSVPSNIVQGIGGLIIYYVIGFAFEKAKIFKLLN